MMRMVEAVIATFALLVAAAAQAQPAPATDPTPGSRPMPLHFGGDATYPPYEYLSEDNGPTGFHVDLARAVGRVLGQDVDVSLGVWTKIRERHDAGEIDFVVMLRSPERESQYLFAEPLRNVTYSIFRRTNGPTAQTTAELAGHTVAVQSGTVAEYRLAQVAGVRTIFVDNERDAVLKLAAGETDFAILSDSYRISGLRDAGVTRLVQPGPPVYSYPYCFAALPGQESLITRIDDAIAVLRANGEYARIEREWFGPQRPFLARMVDRYAAWFAAGAVGVGLLAIAWTIVTRRQVTRATARLESELAARAAADRQNRQLIDRLELAMEGSAGAAWHIEFPPGADPTTLAQPMHMHPRAKAFAGHTDETLPSTLDAWLSLVLPEDLPTVLSEAKRRLQTGEPGPPLEYRIRHRDGSVRWIHSRGSMDWTEDGRPRRYSGMMWDITDRRTAEEAVSLSEAFHRAILVNSFDGKIILDASGAVRFASVAAGKIVGEPAESLVGRRLQDLVAPEDAERAGSLLERFTDPLNHTCLDELRVRHAKFGSRLVEIRSANLLENPVVAGVLLSIRDITERRQAEDSFRRLLESTAPVGEAYFESLTEALGHALRAACIIIAEFSPGSADARIVCGRVEGALLTPGSRVPLGEAILRDIAAGQTQYIQSGCAERFPDEPYVQQLKAESFLGVPLRDSSGRTVGFIIAVGKSPADSGRRPLDLLRIFAARAAAELERAQAEAELRDTRSLLTKALYHLPNVALYQTGGPREFLSQNVETMLGIPASAISADKSVFLSRIPPEELDRIRALVRDWEDRGCPGVLTFSFRAKHTDGRDLWLEDRRVGVQTPRGREVTGVLIDVTEQARGRTLQEQHARRQELLAQLGQSALSESEASRVLAEAIGAVREGLPAAHASVLMGEGPWSEVTGLEDGEPDAASAEPIRVPIKADRGVYGFLEAIPALDETTQADINFMRAVASMISAMLARRTAQETLAANELQYRLLFEDHPHPMWIYETTSLRILRVNEAAVRHYGYSRERFMQMTLLDLRPAEDHDRVRDAVRRAGQQAISESGTWMHRRGDGSEIEAEIISSPAPFIAPDARLVVAIDRTRQQRALRELRETSGFLEALLEYSPLLTFVVDAAGRFKSVNTAARQWLGAEAGPAMGKTPADILPLAAAESIERLIQQARVSSLPCTEQATIRTAAAAGAYLMTAFQVHSGPGGTDVAVIAADITDERQARERLRESEARYRQIFETAQEGIWLIDRDWRTVMINDRLGEILGVDPQTAPGRHILDWFPAGTRPAIEAGMDRRERGISEAQECEFHRPDGTAVWAVVNMNPMLDRAGRFAGALAMVTDITTRRQMETELYEWRQRYALAANTSRQILYDWDTTGDTIVWEGATKAILGFEPEDMGDVHDWIDRIHPDDRERVDRVITTARMNRAAFRVEYRFRRADGSYVHIADDGDFVHTGGRPSSHMIGFMADITERVRDKAELARRAEELARSNADLERFASVASHDLQEPLRMIASYTKLLSQRYKGRLDAQADEFIGYTIEGAHRMQRLIEDLLAYARASAERPAGRPYPARQPLDRALSNLRRLIEETGAQIEVDELPMVRAAESQLATVLQNLIGNAIKFRSNQPPHIRVGAAREGNFWRFSVSDNGIGIDPAQSHRLFNMFTRLHPRSAYEGNGIGLALCKRIIEREGGSVHLESVQGEGTTVYFTLPACDDGAQPAPGSAPQDQSSQDQSSHNQPAQTRASRNPEETASIQ